MSLWGSAEREMVLLSIRVKRALSEDNVKLTRGRIITVSLPFIDLHIDDYGWPWKSRLRRFRPGIGFWYEWSGNDFRSRYHGDATALQGSGRYEAR